MRYLALAADYDGTLAKDGAVAPSTVAALEQVAASGRKLILVTGRELLELLAIFPHIDLFDRVVAENGALLYRPATKETEPLGPPPPGAFVEELRRRRIEPLAVGRSIVATLTPNATAVLEAIQALGLEMQLIFNKNAVMVLPANVNKASGLVIALEELALSPHNVVAVGDGENDHAMLQLAEYSAAVANAVASLREEADRTTTNTHGAGVVELIQDLLASDLAALPPRVQRRTILLGAREDGSQVSIAPAGVNLLVAGSSGSGKSSLANGMLERLAEHAYQYCVIDPEGDYEDLPGAIVFGSAEGAPSMPEIDSALAKPDANIVVNLVGLPLEDRPTFFMSLLPRLLECRATTGRPHWILVDETHHLLPTDWKHAPTIMPEQLTSMIYVTVHPDSIAPSVLDRVDIIAALGQEPAATITGFCRAVGEAAPSFPARSIAQGEALLWLRPSSEPPFVLKIRPGAGERRRHRRKYAEGELPPERSFYFRGSQKTLNLRAQNLLLFLQLADGVDDDTWLHHLRQGDYSTWLRTAIKDDTLANEIHDVELDSDLSPAESRQRARAIIEKRYTVPARQAQSS
jgi:hydroxymethylpyrimidine pyrophosphatase-like HAD family hydrolase